MHTGSWINFRNDKIADIGMGDHEQWVRNPKNAVSMGVPEEVIEHLLEMPTGDKKKRNDTLIYILANSPLMRFRGHGSSVTYEFASRDISDVLEAILMHGMKEDFGPYTNLAIHNLATNEGYSANWQDFQKAMEEDGPQAVLRVAQKVTLQLRKVKEHPWE